MVDDLEPWPEPVDGAEVLYSMEATFRGYASMPERPGASDAVDDV